MVEEKHFRTRKRHLGVIMLLMLAKNNISYQIVRTSLSDVSFVRADFFNISCHKQSYATESLKCVRKLEQN